ncbi:ornithine decarboxylase [Quercus suber]|uniref:ornithine decarboxylase n=1 Tax=Quercus suber TaxID=58331 RepID=A0AAW0LG33_QUESU
MTDFMRSIICSKQETKEPFYVLDLGAVTTPMDRWTRALPTVQPYYAVKCNPNLNFLGAMAALGTNFDCASQAEIESILSLGVSPDRIIFANPCKAESHIKYAASVGVNLTTFDSIDEIKKMQCKNGTQNDSGARCPLGSKFDALPEEVETLLRAAQTAQLTVVGISFHIGSASTDSFAYQQAIAAAKTAFEMATKLGMRQMSVLNIGGGFMANSQFDETATVVKAAIQSCFGNYSGLTVIAEPGRFFAESVFTLATNIISKRIRNELREYWISDGIYGSLNCIILDNAIVKCMPLALTSNLENPACKGSRTYNLTVFGPTCDALDTALKEKIV